MQTPPRQNLPPEVLISCLDVLCRANATLFESDPKLSADIAQAIEALTIALQSQDQSVKPEPASALPFQEPFLEPCEYRKKEIVSRSSCSDDVIVDVLTNEVIRKKPGK